MKLLALDEWERAHFNDLKMLSHDECQNEILVGLTVEESLAYIRYSRYSERIDVNESFVQLNGKHVAAHKEKLIDESYKNYFRKFQW
jgi:hypothetical protein